MRVNRSIAWLFVLLLVALFMAPLYAQEPGTPGSQVPESVQLISTQMVVSYFLVWMIELVKKTKSIPFFEEGAHVANRVLAWVVAIAQAVGIGYSYDTATGTLIITGLSLAMIQPIAVEIGRAYVTQKLLWIMAFKPKQETLAY